MPNPPRKTSLLTNYKGEPDQLLIIQWAGAIFLSLAIGWNAIVDAYLGHEIGLDPNTGAQVTLQTRFKPIGPDTLMFLLGMAGGAASLYNWRRGQDKRHDLELAQVRAPQTGSVNPSPSPGMYSKTRPSQNPLDTMPGDPDARI